MFVSLQRAAGARVSTTQSRCASLWTSSGRQFNSTPLVFGSAATGAGGAQGSRASSSTTQTESDQVTVSSRRLEDFIKAELSFYSQKQSATFTLDDIVQAATPAKVAKLVHEELPVSYAGRIHQIEKLPHFEGYPELAELHRIYSESFRELRMADPEQLDSFSEMLGRLRTRHKFVVPTLSMALQSIFKASFLNEESQRELDEWANAFMLGRCSTEMLTSHYSASASCDPAQICTGIVDTVCDPAQICVLAAETVREKLAIETLTIDVEKPAETIQFSCIPKYLRYILEELLQNAARATIENYPPEELVTRPIKVTVCADSRRVAIRISDKGGGITHGAADKIWSYLYSTKPKPLDRGLWSGSPLAGWGMGMPLTRLYARYLGGNFEIMNMPGIGVDSYLFLSRIDPGENMAAKSDAEND